MANRHWEYAVVAFLRPVSEDRIYELLKTVELENDVAYVEPFAPPVHKTPITWEHYPRLRQLYERGASMRTLAREYRCHPTTIARHLRAAGATIRPRGGPNNTNRRR